MMRNVVPCVHNLLGLNGFSPEMKKCFVFPTLLFWRSSECVSHSACPLGGGGGRGGSCYTGKDQRGRSWEEEEEEKVGGEGNGMSDRSVVFGYRTAWEKRGEGEERLCREVGALAEWGKRRSSCLWHMFSRQETMDTPQVSSRIKNSTVSYLKHLWSVFATSCIFSLKNFLIEAA